MKSKWEAGHKHLLGMLICFTILFVMAQGFLFFVHYKVTDLVDSLVNSSISIAFFQVKILLPVIMFITIQLAAYALFVCWIWFMSVAVGELFKLSQKMTYVLGVGCWILASAALLGLNQYYYPHSFFATLINDVQWFVRFSNIVTLISVVCLLAMTVLAYVNFLLHKSHRIPAMLFLTLMFIFVCDTFYDKYNVTHESVQAYAKPNIIFIGLDSLRPDFTGYFKKDSAHTPNIDKFLSSATTFTKAYSPLARTFPAWMSILTGKYPKNNGARNNLADPVSLLKEDTFAKQLKKAGYETIYASDEKRFSNVTTGYGFDRVVGPGMGFNDFLLGGLGDFPMTNLLVNLPMGRFLFPYNYANRAAAITYEPANFLELLKFGIMDRPNKPMFLAVHLCISHWPFTWARDGETGEGTLPDKYSDGVEAVDKQLGQLLQLLKENGLLQHSVVVMLSDHGTTLGLPDERVINQKNYLGDKKKLKLLGVSKYSSAPENSLNIKNDYGVDTSYGQGTDVLSLKQTHVLMAFKGYGVDLPVQQINVASSLLDIAPTMLDYLHLPLMKSVDGVSLLAYFDKNMPKEVSTRAFFTETGDSLSEIESDHIYVEKVVKHEINVYRINPENGLLFMDQLAERSILENKQHAILYGDWLLARYPTQKRMKIALITGSKNNQMGLKPYTLPAYYVLVNLKSGQWTIGLTSSFAKTAPLHEMMRRFKVFYGDELVAK